MDDNVSTVDILELTLKMRHLFPTAPDTLRAYPFKEDDPFVIRSCPHIYFAGNQEKYEERMIFADNSQN